MKKLTIDCRLRIEPSTPRLSWTPALTYSTPLYYMQLYLVSNPDHLAIGVP